MNQNQKFLTTLLVVFTLAFIGYAFADQPLETESAHPPPAGQIEIELTGEYQTSPDGQELAIPLAIEYGITKDLFVIVEPTPYTAILPWTVYRSKVINHYKTINGQVARDELGHIIVWKENQPTNRADGLGDIEATGVLRFVRETKYLPDLAIAGEIKFPTAHNVLIGTGQIDYTAYFIISKLIGPVDIHLNAGYTVLGPIPGVTLHNQFDYAAAFEWYINKRFNFVGEVIGNTAAMKNVEGTGHSNSATAVTSEVSGGELAGMLGMRVHFSHGISLAFGVSYDNTGALLVRPGLTWAFIP